MYDQASCHISYFCCIPCMVEACQLYSCRAAWAGCEKIQEVIITENTRAEKGPRKLLKWKGLNDKKNTLHR